MSKTSDSIPLNFQYRKEAEMLERSMEFYQQMKSRRTVREFSAKNVSREIIENCLRTAGTSVSGANLQPWHFAVVSDPAIKKKIRVAAEKEEKLF
ncbi:MAG: nitroreductase family protein, partial [Gammaproteobacteria bacterium]|nr:nitroreductase family protein [Gammaproteobacteria bacterium]